MIVFLAGTLLAFNYAYSPVDTLQKQRLADLIERAYPGSTRAAAPVEKHELVQTALLEKAAAPRAPRVFSPSSPLFRATTEVQAPAPTADVTDFGTPAAWRARVIPQPSPSRQIGAQLSYEERVAMARRLQSELRRVGCYWGEVDGDWGPASRRAISSFLNRINATLPVQQPDNVLLSLVQGHASQACETTCKSGEALASDGRCIPTVVVASTPPSKPAPAQTATSIAAKSAKQVAGRDNSNPGISGNAPAPSQSPAVAAAINKPPVWEPRKAVASAAGETRPTASTSTSFILPGRMSIGAPLPAVVEPSAAISPAKTTPSIEPKPVAAYPEQNTRPGSPQRAAFADEDAAAPAPDITGQNAPVVDEVETSARKHHSRHARPDPVERPAARSVSNNYSRSYVKTYQGKVRRGSPQHNLMLSLGGVF